MFIHSRIDKLIELKQNSINGITIQNMAKEMGISISTLNNMKSGISSPAVDKLEVVAKYFGVDFSYFFDNIDDNKSNAIYKLTEATDYFIKRFEELVAENIELKNKVKEYEEAQITSYEMHEVQDLKVAEPASKLKKTDQTQTK